MGPSGSRLTIVLWGGGSNASGELYWGMPALLTFPGKLGLLLSLEEKATRRSERITAKKKEWYPGGETFVQRNITIRGRLHLGLDPKV